MKVFPHYTSKSGHCLIDFMITVEYHYQRNRSFTSVNEFDQKKKRCQKLQREKSVTESRSGGGGDIGDDSCIHVHMRLGVGYGSQ